LPRKPNVEDLLRQFYYHSIATPSDEMSPALLAEILDGVKVYFDFMTEDHLLYGPERDQFRVMVTERRATRPGSRNKMTNSHTQGDTPENSCSPTSHLEHTPSGSNPWQPQQPTPQLEPTTTTKPTSLPESPALMPSQVYGAEHLLRLFLKFPVFLCRAQLPPSHVQLLHHCFKELLAYLCTRRELFSEDNYESQDSPSEEGVKLETQDTTGGGGEEAPPTSDTPTS
jgi:mortality factor 4-like protein 1